MNTNQREPQLLISVNGAAKALCLGRSSIYNLLASSELEAVKIGNRRLIKMSSIEALIARNSGGCS